MANSHGSWVIEDNSVGYMRAGGEDGNTERRWVIRGTDENEG